VPISPSASNDVYAYLRVDKDTLFLQNGLKLLRQLTCIEAAGQKPTNDRQLHFAGPVQFELA
jgi:hypothetical protein